MSRSRSRSFYEEALSEPPERRRLIGTIGAHSVNMESSIRMHLGGAMSRSRAADTAYGRRDAPYPVTGEATWTDPRK